MNAFEKIKRSLKSAIKIIRKSVYSGFFAFLIILIASQMCLNLSTDLSKTPCEFHACKYKDILQPSLAILTSFLFLPIFITFVTKSGGTIKMNLEYLLEDQVIKHLK